MTTVIAILFQRLLGLVLVLRCIDVIYRVDVVCRHMGDDTLQFPVAVIESRHRLGDQQHNK
ncbi:hypothetical protein [Microbulbifer donghaiensis]|uniref:hypothetical protein n=1 Tax=Microbulbifer donghaiensis TaxID=494016 RepID=UPI00116129B8|nr:hypothetical protein [Microbulbifer donghaiensis]